MDDEEKRITLLLEDWQEGNPNVLDELWPLVLHQLKIIARNHMRGERQDHTFSTMDLVHEVYCKLFAKQGKPMQSRGHFFAVAAKAMRHILINHAHKRNAQRRGGGELERVSTDPNDLGDEPEEKFAELDLAIAALEKANPQAALIIELHFFCGCRVDEIAEILKISAPTVKRRLQFSKAWLGRYLTRS